MDIDPVYQSILLFLVLSACAGELQDKSEEIWSKCSLTCGGGVQYQLKNKTATRLCNTMGCPDDAGCLSLYLSFDQVTGKTIYDESGNGNLGTLVGSAEIVDKGKFGKALKFTKNGSISFDVVNFKNRPSLAITLSLWLKLSDTKGNQEIFFTCGKPQLYNVGAYHLGVEEGTVKWSLKDENGDKIFNLSSAKPMNKSTWYHIAGTYRLSTGDAKLYINGKMNEESKAKKQVKPDDQWMCADVGSSKDKKLVEGFIDEFYIFKCALLPQEISELYSKNAFKKFLIPKPNDIL